MTKTSKTNKNKVTNLRMMIIAACLYGSWAFYINSYAGLSTAFLSATTQALLSFFITGILIMGMDYCFTHIQSLPLRLLSTAFVPLLLVLGIVTLAHLWVGTPRIIQTITPSALIGSCYCLSYTSNLFLQAKRQIPLA